MSGPANEERRFGDVMTMDDGWVVMVIDSVGKKDEYGLTARAIILAAPRTGLLRPGDVYTSYLDSPFWKWMPRDE